LSSLEQNLWQLSPELILLLVGGILLGLDALRLRRNAGRWSLVVALAGMAGAFVATATLWDSNAQVLSVLSRDGFALAINGIALVTTGLVALISSFYVETRPNPHKGAFYALLLVSALAICLIGAATDLIMIVLAFELFNIVSYILIGYLRGDPRSSEAAIKYFLTSAAFSGLMLYGLSWFYGLTGTTGLEGIASALVGGAALGEPGAALRPMMLPALILVTAGLAAKVAAAPFHQWMPDICQGTSVPVATLFSVSPVVAGFAGLMRVLLIALPPDSILATDWRTLLMAVAAITMAAGSLTALWQQNAKRLLAYLSIAQVGYLLVGVVAASPHGVTAALFALMAYVVSTLGTLVAIVALSHHTGSYAIESYAGMHRRSPAVAWALLLCLLSLVGIPPTAGFVGRLNLFSGAIEEGLLWLAIVGVMSGVISFACVWRIIRVVFTTPTPTEERLTVPPALAVALGIAAVGIFAIAIFAGPLLTILEVAAEALLR
jgi:NADH-quinone oxidoreductase subunit N